MPTREAMTDDEGFVIPQKFEDFEQEVAPPEPRPRRRSRSRSAALLRYLLGVGLLLGLFLAVFGPELKETFGREFAQQALGRARQAQMQGDFRGAAKALDRAVFWLGEEPPRLIQWRAYCNSRCGELRRSLADYDQYLEHAPRDVDALLDRGFVLQRLGRTRDALNDCDKAVELAPTAEEAEASLEAAYERANVLNSRAYNRALAGEELTGALDDVGEALLLLGDEPPMFIGVRDWKEYRAMYLDTRGYVLHLLERRKEALADFDEAIAIVDELDDATPVDGLEARMQRRQYDEHRAVMKYHRADVLETLGRTQEAERERAAALRLGYDPDAGVL